MQSVFFDKESGSFPDNWGGVNALTKRVVRDILESMDLPYSKELGRFVRGVVEFPFTQSYIEWKRGILGLSIEEAVYGEY